MKKGIIGIMMICALATDLRAADWQNWSNFSSVTAMFQQGGNLWVAGHGGVVVIDTNTGQKTFYKKTAGQLPSLMVEDMAYSAATGTTWIGTYDNGLVSIHNGQFVNYAFPNPSVRLYHLAIDQTGAVWCATNNGLFKFNNGTYTQINWVNVSTNTWGLKFFPNGRLLIASNQPEIYDVALDTAYSPSTPLFAYKSSQIEVIDDTSYYFASDHGGIIYVHDTTVVDITDTMVVNGFSTEVTQLKRLSDGTLLALRSDNKVFSYNGTSWSPYAYTADAENSQATFLMQKSSGAVVAGGIYQGGLIKGLGNPLSVSIQKFGIWSDVITALKEKTNHELWVMGGTQVGLYDLNTASFERIDTLPGVTWSTAGGIVSWNGTFVAFGYNNLYQWTGSGWTPLTIPGVINYNITGLVTDTSGGLYVAGSDGVYIIHGSTVVHYYSANTGAFNNNDYVRTIYFDAVRNTVWMATSAGIVRYTAGAFSIINSSNTPQISYYNYISAIAQDPAGDMWFGTAYGGLIHYDGTMYTLDTMPQSTGNQTVNGIAFDGSTMYVGDNVYGFWVNENGSWTNYNTGNSDMTCNYITSLYADRNHNVWLTSTGYSVENSFGLDIYNKTAVVLSVQHVKETAVLNAFPNPTTSLLTISDPTIHDGAEVTLTDMTGRNYAFTLTSHHIDISSLASGIYILHIKGAEPVRVIKE